MRVANKERKKWGVRKDVTPEIEEAVLSTYAQGYGIGRIAVKYYLSESKLVIYLKAKGVYRSRAKG